MSKVPSPYERLGITPVTIQDKADTVTSKDLAAQLAASKKTKPKKPTVKKTQSKPVKKQANQKYDPDFHPQAATEYLSKGYPVRTLGTEFKVSRETIQRWQVNHPEFDKAVKEGQQGTEKFYVDLAMDLANGTKKGNVAAAIFLMKNIIGYKDTPETQQETQPITINFGIAPKPSEPV